MPQAKDKHPPEVRPELISLASVAPRTVDWLWKPYIPAGMLCMISGDPGAGKTFIALSVSAAFTTGHTPDGQPCEPIDVIYLSVENAPAEVVRPRFDSLGGDPARALPFTRGGLDGSGESIQAGSAFPTSLILDAALERNGGKTGYR